MRGRLPPPAPVFLTLCVFKNLGLEIGAAGPHGSGVEHLLKRPFALEPMPSIPGQLTPGMLFSPDDLALCDKCHDIQGSILRDESFRGHIRHIRGAKAACSTCHDPHGSQAAALMQVEPK